MFPHESEVAVEITRKHRAQLDRMTKLHDAVITMLAVDHWTIEKKRGVDPRVIHTMFDLLAKAAKTFRAIQILCERGYQEDANALARVLMETTYAILFILQKKSKHRALVFHAHGIAQGLRMLNEWKNTPGLRRKATKDLLKQTNDGLADHIKQLPVGTDVKRHWSGKPNLQEVLKALRGSVVYATLYRYSSSISHVSDFGARFNFDSMTGDPVWEIEPTVRGFEAPSYAARVLLWNAANRINQRLGLGFSAILAPHELTRSMIREEAGGAG